MRPHAQSIHRYISRTRRVRADSQSCTASTGRSCGGIAGRFEATLEHGPEGSERDSSYSKTWLNDGPDSQSIRSFEELGSRNETADILETDEGGDAANRTEGEENAGPYLGDFGHVELIQCHQGKDGEDPVREAIQRSLGVTHWDGDIFDREASPFCLMEQKVVGISTGKSSDAKVGKPVKRIDRHRYIYDHSLSLVDNDPQEEESQGDLEENRSKGICGRKRYKVLDGR